MESIELLKEGKPQIWRNPNMKPAAEALHKLPFTLRDIEEADARLRRFAPLIAKLFPETEGAGGVIESPLAELKKLREFDGIKGRLFLKQDSELPIAGSVKARGGIYEVLKHTEDILGEAVFSMTPNEIRSKLGGYTVQVGSTGNLGLSIGIMSAALGYRAVVHMSSDAKEWKKNMLREKGVTVIEYDGDYSSAVARGRELSNEDPKSYFVDDENSLPLFMGYAVAALRLKKQLEKARVNVDAEHPLNLNLPCGVGGAPGGITFGAKVVFGDSVNCWFVEPTQAPCMLAAFLTGGPTPVTGLGLSGKTEADGLAVGTASKLVYDTVKELVSGEITVIDGALQPYQNELYDCEGIYVEPSSAAALEALKYLDEGIPDGANVTHIAWATGGRLVPESERKKQLYTRVCAALIWRGGRFLACRRPPNKARGGLWEFVGGKVEKGETGEQALVRECREELGIGIEVRGEFMSLLHRYPDLTVWLTLYNARISEGEPQLLEHTQLAWVAPNELGDYEFCPADEGILAVLGKGNATFGRLLEFEDRGYGEFQRKLVPNVDPHRIIGVRLPDIRAIAKEIRGTEEAERFMFALPHFYYDEDMLHAMLINEIKDIDRLFYEIDEFLPLVDNWAVCDTIKPKAFKKHRQELWEKIPEYLASPHEYTVRFGIGMLMAHFLDDDFVPEALELADGVYRDEYYVKMMKAWFFATALAKQY
ncbi:MAG: D-serine ammonia-lyase, partial [Clostridia bacterium]|nr:D-serine ammonia-lyase [Clostridia bacterium]